MQFSKAKKNKLGYLASKSDYNKITDVSFLPFCDWSQEIT